MKPKTVGRVFGQTTNNAHSHDTTAGKGELELGPGQFVIDVGGWFCQPFEQGSGRLGGTRA